MGNKVWLSEYMSKDAGHYSKGRVITSIDGMNKDSEEVNIHFVDGGVLTLRHEQDCCESVDLQDFYGEDERGVVLSFEERSADADDDENVSESGTWTFYSIQTTTGEIWMRWLGESNGYYSESVATTVTNGEYVLVVEEGAPKLYRAVDTMHDEVQYVLAVEGRPGMSMEDMEKWVRMAGEVTKS